MSSTTTPNDQQSVSPYSLVSADGTPPAVQEYLDDREGELSPATVDKNRRQLEHFAAWCAERDVTTLEGIEPLHIHRYKNERQNEVAPTSLKTVLSTVNMFLSMWERLGVIEDVAEAVDTSQITVSREDRVREDRLDEGAAKDILDYLSKHHPYDRERAVFYTMWEGGMRTGAVVALDIEDYHPRRKSLELHHRPEQGTRLKNGDKGEREIMVSDTLADILDGYIAEHRPDKTDDYGREPLFTTRKGRISTTSVRRIVYTLTERCELVDGRLAGHAVRKGAIGRHLSNGWDIQDVAERCDVTEKNLRRHYDLRPENEKMDARRRKYDL